MKEENSNVNLVEWYEEFLSTITLEEDEVLWDEAFKENEGIQSPLAEDYLNSELN